MELLYSDTDIKLSTPLITKLDDPQLIVKSQKVYVVEIPF